MLAQGTEINSVYREYFYWLQAQSEWARAIQDYNVSDPALLSFSKVCLRVYTARAYAALTDASRHVAAQGDIVHVLEKDDPEWFVGDLRGKRGSFPSNHVVLFLRPPPDAVSGGRDARKRAPTAKMTPEELARHQAAGGGQGADAHGGRRTRSGSIMKPRQTDASAADTRERGSTRSRASSSVRPVAAGGGGANAAAAAASAAAAAAAPAKDRYNPTLWEQYKVDAARYRFEAFAAQFFRALVAPGTGTIRKPASTSPRGPPATPKELANFSRDPLKDSLLVLDLNSARMSLDICRAIMKYMDDLPRGRMTDVELVQIIMQYGLDHGDAAEAPGMTYAGT